MVKIGPKIKQIRELRNYTQEYVAEKLGMSSAGYSRIERNQVDVNYEKLNKLASIFEVDVSELIKFDDKAIFNFQSQTITNGVYYQMQGNEKQLYEALIEQLKSENMYLKAEIERLRKEN